MYEGNRDKDPSVRVESYLRPVIISLKDKRQRDATLAEIEDVKELGVDELVTVETFIKNIEDVIVVFSKIDTTEGTDLEAIQGILEELAVLKNKLDSFVDEMKERKSAATAEEEKSRTAFYSWFYNRVSHAVSSVDFLIEDLDSLVKKDNDVSMKQIKEDAKDIVTEIQGERDNFKLAA